MSFVRDVLAQVGNVVWISGAALLGIFAYFGIDSSVPMLTRSLLAVSGCLIILFLMMTSRAYSLYTNGVRFAKIKQVVMGSYLYAGQPMVVLDKATWIVPGQLLTLLTEIDGVRNVFAILNVEAFTAGADGGASHPQCTIVRAFLAPEVDVAAYIMDPTRWRTMIALPNIQHQHLFRSTDE